MEGYEDVAALGEGDPPETRIGCDGGGSNHVLREFVSMKHA